MAGSASAGAGRPQDHWRHSHSNPAADSGTAAPARGKPASQTVHFRWNHGSHLAARVRGLRAVRSGSLSLPGPVPSFCRSPVTFCRPGLVPRQPPTLVFPPSGITPRPEGSGVEPSRPPTDPLLPGGTPLEKLSGPGRSRPRNAEIPDKDVPVPKSPILSPDLTPSPPAKPDERSPAKPLKDSSFSRRRQDAVAARATTIRNDLPMQANWNASLEPEAVGDNHLRSGSFQQRGWSRSIPSAAPWKDIALSNCKTMTAGSPAIRTYKSPTKGTCTISPAKRPKSDSRRPRRSMPRHGGDDVVLAVEENRTVPGSVNHSAVWQGRLYLFANSASLAAFQKDPSRYTDGPRQTPLQIPANSL